MQPSTPTANATPVFCRKGLAKLQAGDYDEATIRGQLETLVSEPAVMFSFTT